MNKKGPNFTHIQSLTSRAQAARRLNEICQAIVDNLNGITPNRKYYLLVINALIRRAEAGETRCEYDNVTWMSVNATLYSNESIHVTVKSLLQWEGFSIEETRDNKIIVSWD
jgi:hypothetical protein